MLSCKFSKGPLLVGYLCYHSTAAPKSTAAKSSKSKACKCPRRLEPVCGKDGKDYTHPCYAECEGMVRERDTMSAAGLPQRWAGRGGSKKYDYVA